MKGLFKVYLINCKYIYNLIHIICRLVDLNFLDVEDACGRRMNFVFDNFVPSEGIMI